MPKAILVGNSTGSGNTLQTTTVLAGGRLYGDYNGDGIVDLADLTEFRSLVNAATEYQLEDLEENLFYALDTNKDGVVNNSDYELLDAGLTDGTLTAADALGNWTFDETKGLFKRGIQLEENGYFTGTITFDGTGRYSLSNIVSAECDGDGVLNIYATMFPSEDINCSILYKEDESLEGKFIVVNNGGGLKHYTSLEEVGKTAANPLEEVFKAMSAPSKLTCEINSETELVNYPFNKGVLTIEKVNETQGSATYIYDGGRVAHGNFN